MSKASSISRGHPSWATKARSLASESFIVRTVVDRSNILIPSILCAPSIRYGIVVKKKIGCAVLRNRIKRRIRAAFQTLDSSRLQVSAHVSYIVVVRQASIAQLPFSDVCDQLKGLLRFYE